MKKLFYAACTYMILGLAAGAFYREFTKFNGFPAGEYTQLAFAHTHLLTLGCVVFLIVLALEKVFQLSRSQKLFAWFFGLYNAGIVVTAAMLIVHGILTVLGAESSAAIAGIAGIGHMLLTAAFIVFFVMLGRAVRAEDQAQSAFSSTGTSAAKAAEV